jgi:hypothetical protein
VRRTVLIISALAAVVIVVIAVVIGVSAYKTTAESIASGTYSPPPVSIGTLSGVVATGDLHPIYPATPTTGHVTITADPSKGTFIVTLSHFHGEKSSLSESRSANLTSTEVDTKVDGSCAPSGLTFSFGDAANRTRQSFQLPGASLGGPAAENPSFYHDLTITEGNGAIGPDGCPAELLAYAPLHWTIGDLRSDITVVDKGWVPGATGEVVTKNRHPYSYTVVAGDNLTVIAQRFNLTLEQLFYLNPARLPGPTDPVAHEGEILNLSKGNR